MPGDLRALTRNREHDERTNNISAANADTWRARGDHDTDVLADVEFERRDRLDDYTPAQELTR